MNDGKTIIIEKNWQVTSEEPLARAKVAEGSTVELGVKHLTDETPTTDADTHPHPGRAKGCGPRGPAGREGRAGGTTSSKSTAGGAAGRGGAAGSGAPPVYSGIICKDGYAWPGTTRRGACHGHGGIA